MTMPNGDYNGHQRALDQKDSEPVGCCGLAIMIFLCVCYKLFME